jgi:hypothetical protein
MISSSPTLNDTAGRGHEPYIALDERELVKRNRAGPMDRVILRSMLKRWL